SGIPLPVIEYGKKRVFLSAKAEYRIGGILVSKRRYTNGFMSDLSPWDYAMIWGDVPNFINHIKFDQIVRYCLFKYDPSQGIDVDYVSRHLSNNHLIPANKNIRKALKAGKKGMSVELSGYLVDVDAVLPGGGSQTWRSSMKRDDTAGGACEIIYVTRLRLGDRVYE
ncbi:MAG: hypothetical protein U1B83_00460, partial [Candidatus Cloacimonadaceae bacterium]|nr:hypothetical protein [Candidatus Cloacimonadaceae bacterium]